MTPLLEPLAQSLNYADLPESWRVPDIDRFSTEKTLYDYQTDALENAARALFLYYENEHDWTPGEPPQVNHERKRKFADLYGNHGIADLKRYDTLTNEKHRNENPVFRILSDYLTPQGDHIPYHNLINRMCFWMATGSGKTLVMVKLIEYLHSLQRHEEIPRHNILILAPSEHLLGQIRRTISEFNRAGGLQIDFLPLRQTNQRPYQGSLGNSIAVYYHRSDNISDVQKEALTDYRTYENDGKWYVFLDEAHKGGKEDSKRQAYYAIMAREGFLFNFSATFTDREDIVTTVKKYNLEEFVENGYGKNIYLNEREYDAFTNRTREISHVERRKIVLKSLVTLGHVSMRATEVRGISGMEDLYHLPLMLTLVNSVNTDMDNRKNDLWAFFQTLREIATGEIDLALFEQTKKDLLEEWRNAALFFKGDGGVVAGIDEASVKRMKITDLREAIFHSRRRGAIQLIRGEDNKELAFQMKNADAPFALIRIGDTSKWRNTLLEGFEETTALKKQSFFARLEKSNITILMGSRAFFESWDSNRPNVINFINIGGNDAKKFVVQSVGRGVRIEPLPNERRRLDRLWPKLKEGQRAALQSARERVGPLETLFLFATNRRAVGSVLDGMKKEQGAAFKPLKGFEQAQRQKAAGADMPLLVPDYKDAENAAAESPFAMSDATRKRLEAWLERTSDSVFVVRDGLRNQEIDRVRALVEKPDGIESASEKDYATIPWLQSRLVSHVSRAVKVSNGVRELNEIEDIVHFRRIRVRPEYEKALKEKVDRVRKGGIAEAEDRELARLYGDGIMDKKEYDKRREGSDEESFNELRIRKLLGHYYLPVIQGNERADYIQHIVKVRSEIEFLEKIEKWTAEQQNFPWDAWMFSKIDESADEVYIPYYDSERNEYRRFLPDFIFWMCKGNQYRIVFVDPKSTAYNAADRKLDGYRKLFEEENGTPLNFHHGRFNVQVVVWMFNEKPQGASREYRRHWTQRPEDIFRCDTGKVVSEVSW